MPASAPRAHCARSARSASIYALALVALLLAAFAPPALAKASHHKVTHKTSPFPIAQPSDYVPPPAFGNSPDIQHLKFRYGPLQIGPGANMILLSGDKIPRPSVDGYIVGIRPDFTLTDGTVPSVNVIHLHHAVWLNLSAGRDGEPADPEFFASGEEKTYAQLPRGFGYPFHTTDKWVLNYMIHNLTPAPFSVYVTYQIDFVPATSALAQTMKPAYPLWMDVQRGSAYPVFNALRGSGTKGMFTYPLQANNPYGSGPAKNVWTVPKPMTLIAVSGHVHPGGLYDDLSVNRPGVASPARSGRAAQTGPKPGDAPNSVLLFRSQAHYWDPNGPLSWDHAMTLSKPNWRVSLQPGDQLRVDATYDVQHQSWYEVMGIMVAYVSWDPTVTGVDPFKSAVDTTGHITHGEQAANKDFGGVPVANLPNPLTSLTTTAPNNTVQINNFTYEPGDINESIGALPQQTTEPPTIRQGQSLTFVNNDDTQHIFHTITDCALPCTRSTGSHYPLANGPVIFDSGELGTGPVGFTAASNSITWKTPSNLPPGTYTYFCRIHPFMRGVFRVIS